MRGSSRQLDSKVQEALDGDLTPGAGFYVTRGDVHLHFLKQLCQQARRFSLARYSALPEESLNLKTKMDYRIVKDFPYSLNASVY